MGIERFFSSLSRDFDIVEDTKIPYKRVDCTHLMLDFNSIVHITSAHMIDDINKYLTKKNNSTRYRYDNINDFENDLLKLIQKYVLDLLKNNLVSNNINYLLICIDGVPTMAKIYEQKKRRYMGSIMGELSKKMEMPFRWSKNNISPGTNFMNKLEKMLGSTSFKENVSRVCRNIKGYLLSDTKYQGEGEMKILNCIRNISINNKICVYSPDSDMIILLMLVDHNVTLLRYNQQKSTLDDKTYNILNIYKFKNILINYCKNRCNFKFDEKRLVNDIIFIFTIFGDDFLPKLETFRVDKDIFIILDYYLINLIDYGYLIDRKDLYRINTKTFYKYIESLQQTEEMFLLRNYFINKYSNYNRADKSLFTEEIKKIEKVINNSNIKNIEQIKNNKELLYSIKKYFKNHEFYLNLLKNLDGGQLRIFCEKYNFKYQRTYHNLFFHKLEINELILVIISFYIINKKFPIILSNKFNKYNLKLLPYTYESRDKQHLYKLDKLDYNEKITYKIENKLDEYYNLLNPKDQFYHKYFNEYNKELNNNTINNYYRVHFEDYKIENVLKEYFRGLNWVVNYYFNNITDNIWYYPFGKSPLLYNIKNQYMNFESTLSKIVVDNFSMSPLEQLLFITPFKIKEDVFNQLSILNNILTFNDLQKIVKFILNNEDYFFNLTEIYKNILNNEDKILDCSTSIFISKCHLTFLEKYVNIKNFCKEFRNYLPFEYQIKFYPTFNKLICVN